MGEIALEHAQHVASENQATMNRYQDSIRQGQARLDDEQKAKAMAREQCANMERRAHTLQNNLEEARTLLEQTDRARRAAEQECNESISDLSSQNQSIAANKRHLEAELENLKQDLDDASAEARMVEDKATSSMMDAARLADDLRMEQDNTSKLDNDRRMMESQVNELQKRLDEAEMNALENELDGEQRRLGDASKNLRKSERRIKELEFQSEEDRKHHGHMQDLVEKLQQKLKLFKRQIEEAEGIAAMNLAKFRKTQVELEEAEERADLSEQALAKLRAMGRSRGTTPVPPSGMPHQSML